MRFSLFLATIGALAGSALAAPQTILVEAQIVELTTNDPEPPKDLSRLTEEKGADVLTFSTLETPPANPPRCRPHEGSRFPTKTPLKPELC